MERGCPFLPENLSQSSPPTGNKRLLPPVGVQQRVMAAVTSSTHL